MIFILLDYNEIHKKQKFSALDIVESRVKRSGLFPITCVDIIAQVSLTRWSIFLFLDVPTGKLRTIIILPTDQPDIILPTARTTNNQVAFVLVLSK